MAAAVAGGLPVATNRGAGSAGWSERGRVKIYTRRGDRGETGLLGGARVPKTDPRVRAYGEVDELNAALGLALALDAGEGPAGGALAGVQDDLFAIGARLASPDGSRADRQGTIPAFGADRIAELESRIDGLVAELPELRSFILPGGTPAASQAHVARTVCRRAERAIAALLSTQPDLGDLVIPYMNRLSDLLFCVARAANHRAGRPEVPWRPEEGRGAGDGGPSQGEVT